MITLHHLENSRSFRILWLLEELGLDYELVEYKRDKASGQAEAELRKQHALGKAPLLVDGEQVVIESGAIIEYLLDRYGEGRFRPAPDSPDRIRYNYWLHASEGTVMTLMILSLFLNRMETQPPLPIRAIVKLVTGQVKTAYLNPNLKKIIDYIEAELGEHKWFAGAEFTAADVQMGFAMTALSARAGLKKDHPNCQRWLEQVEARPAYQRAMERNGEMKLLGS
ncbi:MAG: glutathione S-transferase [Gammaproteobacteria bacterium]